MIFNIFLGVLLADLVFTSCTYIFLSIKKKAATKKYDAALDKFLKKVQELQNTDTKTKH